MEEINKTWVSRILVRTEEKKEEEEEGEREEEEKEREHTVSPPQLSSIPSMLWAQVTHKLQPLVELNMGTGMCRVIRWSHRYFAEFAESRYLQSEDQIQTIYNSLADYFGGKYACSQGKSPQIAGWCIQIPS